MADAAPQSSPSSAAAQVMAESQLSPASDGVTSGAQAGEMPQWHSDGREFRTLKDCTERAVAMLVSALHSIKKATKHLEAKLEERLGEPPMSGRAAKRAKREELLDAFVAGLLLPEEPLTCTCMCYLHVAAKQAVAASRAAAAAAAVSQVTAKDLAAMIERQKELQYRLHELRWEMVRLRPSPR